MPSEPTTRPRILKGALVVHESQTAGPPPKVIVFQYNPEQVKRSLEKRAVEAKGGGGSTPSREDLLRAAGPPAETINLQITLDAADQLAEPDSHQSTVEHGLFPVLSVLEMLLYPPTSRVQQIDTAAGQGEVQVSPADLPLVLLVWGQSRVVPVMLTSFAISEEGFDVNLNPIRAKVDLTMKVLTYLELKRDTIGYDAYLSYQRRKEQHAASYSAGAGEAAVLQTVDQSRR